MNSRTVLAALAALHLAGCAAAANTEPARLYVQPRTAADDRAPYSGAVLIGRTLYLSGQIGVDENLRVPDSAEDEARAVLNGIRNTLEAAGMTMDDLVYVQVFCPDLSLYDTFNRVYRTYFRREFPARAFIGSGPLLFGGRFEVQGIAVRQ